MSADAQTDPAKTAAEPTPIRGRTPSKPWWLLLTIAVTALACFHFPQTAMYSSLDPAWSGVLVYAREKGMQFGRDIVFTYGPLGFFAIDYFLSYEIVARIIFEVALGFGIATGICLMAWRMSLPWRWACLGFFIFATSPLHWGGDVTLLDEGLFAWGLLCFLESGPRLYSFAAVLTVLAAIGALVKFTYLLTGLFTVSFVAGDLLLRGRRGLGSGMLAGFALAFVAIWLLMGQNLTGLVPFLVNSFSVASGYNAAMDLRDASLKWFEPMAIMALVAVVARALSISDAGTTSPQLRKLLLMMWLGGLVFESWKYGCVRTHSTHLAFTFGFIPFAALAMGALPAVREWPAWFSRVAVVVCCFCAAIVSLRSDMAEYLPKALARESCRNMRHGLAVVLQPARYIREKTAALKAEEEKSQFPKIRAAVGGATADVFGENQAVALFNHLNYRPRPIFQSYSAYNRRLMELNERFYLSANAPDYVLFNLSPIDDRFAPLEDAFALRDILANYEMVLTEANYLLLRRKGTAGTQMTLVKEGTVSAGEKIDLQNYPKTNLWLEIDAQPSTLGRLEQFLFKFPETQLVLWSRLNDLPPGAGFTAPAVMLSAGFLASPVILDTPDAWALYAGGQVRRPDAYSVELGGSPPGFWKPQIHFRLYTIANPLGAHPP